jgi:hypothetical protein
VIYELRIYTATPDKMPDLLARFRNHALKIFERHDIKSIGYWLNHIGGRNDELIYIVAFDDMAQREKAWAAMGADPDWQKIRGESNKDGNIVHHITNQIMVPTDFSPLS